MHIKLDYQLSWIHFKYNFMNTFILPRPLQTWVLNFKANHFGAICGMIFTQS